MSEQDLSEDFLVKADDLYFDRLKKVKDARFKLGIRAFLALLGALMAVYFISIAWEHAPFFFKKGDSPIDLGDVRSKNFDPAMVEFLTTNDFVSFKNDVIMFDELQSQEFFFYYSPMTHFIVRTTRQLPDKNPYRLRDSVLEVDDWEARMITDKKAYLWDLKVSFDGRGRIIAFADMPKWARPMASFMSNSSGVPAEKMKLFLDGEEPSNYSIFIYLIIAAVALALVTLALVVVAAVRYNREKRQLGDVPWSQL